MTPEDYLLLEVLGIGSGVVIIYFIYDKIKNPKIEVFPWEFSHQCKENKTVDTDVSDNTLQRYTLDSNDPQS